MSSEENKTTTTKRGRPQKYFTEEERHNAILAQKRKYNNKVRHIMRLANPNKEIGKNTPLSAPTSPKKSVEDENVELPPKSYSN